MSAVPFDTLKLAARLEAGGFTPEQARTFASAMADAASSADLVTKPDLDAGLAGLKREIDGAKREFEAALLNLEQRMTIRLDGIMVIAVGILLAAIRYLPPSPH
jgi:hypothetical protein